MEIITNSIYVISRVFIFLFGVILIISPNKMLNYFVKKDLKKLKDNDKNTDEHKLIKESKIICRIGGVYCIVLILLDKVIISNSLAFILGYFIIPIVGLYSLENKFK
ncbi:hypothetical protein [Paraclostridium bifermentans]|uniref:hypothetical protein n=1 Tax=Paraclostridium bifermentans TaxID=1490 RepID=UPI00387B8C49